MPRPPPSTPPAQPEEQLAAHLAENLRHQRQVRALTQQRLARLTGVPRSTLAQIESGSANPTLAVLSRLSLALQVSIEELLSAPRARCQLYPKGTLPQATRGAGGKAVVHTLLPDAVPGMEIDRIELKPGARLQGVPHRPGTREYLACEAGRIVLWARGERLELGVGDVAAFDGDQPHSYHNEGRDTAVGFSVVALSPLPGAAGGRAAR